MAVRWNTMPDIKQKTGTVSPDLDKKILSSDQKPRKFANAKIKEASSTVSNEV